MELLQEAIIYLLAAIIAVPISKRLGFGAVLGYLAAGIVIGPFGLGLIDDPEHILHFAELGVVFLLFIIGLELKPTRLWVLRKMVFGLGAAQVFASAALIAVLAWSYGIDARASTVIGFILALSSTPFVLQLLAEKKQLMTSHGRAAFSTLLFQDLAVIPLIALLPLLGASAAESGGFDVMQLGLMAGTVAALLIGGHYLLRPVLRIAAGSEIPEIFTATALVVVIGAALLMYFAGMSMVLGAFIAGMLLADSEYRHQLEIDIAPFKGLLLGLFFIAVGMSVNLGLLMQAPGKIMLFVVALMIAKAIVLLPLTALFSVGDGKTGLRFAVLMAQGGEFAFVLFAIAGREGILATALIDELILAVAVSMLLSPLTYMFAEYVTGRMDASIEPEFDEVENEHHEVIIAGFGRVGQIVARMLRSVGKPFTALEIDSTQIDVVRRYGNKVYYGDASRVDLLRAAGAANAKVLVLAIDDIESSVQTAESVVKHFPHLRIVARARNRKHALALLDLGIDRVCRETLLSSISMGEDVLGTLGFAKSDKERVSRLFKERDEQLLAEQRALEHSEEALIQSARDTARELESLMQDELKR